MQHRKERFLDFEKEEQRIVLKENQKTAGGCERRTHIILPAFMLLGRITRSAFPMHMIKMECGRHFVCRGLQNGNRSGWTQSIAAEAVKEFGNMRK